MTLTLAKSSFLDDVKACARCGEDHSKLHHQPFARPFAPPEAHPIVWEWWATCPVTGDPILVALKNPKGNAA